jgi:hypothetical protein
MPSLDAPRRQTGSAEHFESLGAQGRKRTAALQSKWASRKIGRKLGFRRRGNNGDRLTHQAASPM